MTETAPATRARIRFDTRTLLTLAAIGAAAGVVVIPTAWAAQVLWAAIPVLYGLAVVPYVLPGVIAQAVVPQPGSALITGLVAGLISIPFVGGVGPLTLFVFVAVLQELPSLVTAWRFRGIGMALVTALVLSAAYAAYWAVTLNAEAFAGWVRITAIALLVVTILLSTLLGLAIAAGLRRAGIRPRR
ncbi:ECF transporter S component [Protaetiibacter intestinalis]|uniref:ECF transporter S component n=1 Tax=Protaetiibacter intestinalis TaxID=2419774 RepID=A0A387B3W8_9MICO|nr:ECF transporter S component [Protaetiibacter intestinalis]AYF98324.1 hypothetical protein D7I47_08685 [Protaetiibacter intestinalis]